MTGDRGPTPARQDGAASRAVEGGRVVSILFAPDRGGGVPPAGPHTQAVTPFYLPFVRPLVFGKVVPRLVGRGQVQPFLQKGSRLLQLVLSLRLTSEL